MTYQMLRATPVFVSVSPFRLTLRNREITAVTLTVSKFLVLIAVLCAAAAFIVVAFGVTNPKIWPETIALSLAFGWASMLVL